MFQFALPALAVAGQFMTDGTISKFINLAMGVLIAGEDVKINMKALNDKIQELADNGLEPSQDDWDVLTARSDDAGDAIHGDGG